ncbi:MAG: activator of HSP90 ATPase 1 family protein [Saprospiraceae bacterium]|nr:activator of HSP90 ATPase 1 family protein [Saprospiraceae bacterium]
MERVKIEVEYVFRASPQVLYQFFIMPDRLIRWFCDAVYIDDNVFTFEWNGSSEEAILIEDIENTLVRFSWSEQDEDEFFEFDLSISPVTGDTILMVRDFCDADEIKDQEALWDSQLKQLKRETGEGL